MSDALGAIDAINADYEHHSKAARDLAEQYFSAPKVGVAFLKEIGAG
jgi:hypothetical protein